MIRLAGAFLCSLVSIAATLFALLLYYGEKSRQEERPVNRDARRGFEVKQNPGTTPGAEEKEIDHG